MLLLFIPNIDTLEYLFTSS